jgi:nucleotide-binding universal stress UspA family protein
MNNVLVPFDGSPSVKRAIQYLVDFARSNPNLSVHVINVQTEPTFFGNYGSPSMIEQFKTAALEHAGVINAEAVALLGAAKIRCQSHEMLGDVVAEVTQAAAKYGCDTVVMGTRGMSSLGNLVMGSVANRVVHEVPVPVLLVK